MKKSALLELVQVSPFCGSLRLCSRFSTGALEEIMMAKSTISVSAALSLLPLVALAGPAGAAVLTAPQLTDLVQSTFNDVDSQVLTFLSGQSLGGPLSYTYSSTATDDSWSSWSGVYVGRTGALLVPFNLSYIGSGTATSVNWSVTGQLGGGTVSGGGSASISYPTPSTFDLTYADDLEYDGSTALFNVVYPGTLLAADQFMLGSPEAPVVGKPAVKYSYEEFKDGSWRDDIHIDDEEEPRWISHGDRSGSNLTNAIIPEPSTWVMILLGFDSLGYAALRRKATGSGGGLAGGRHEARLSG